MNGEELNKHYERVIKSKEELIEWYLDEYYSITKAKQIVKIIEKEIKHLRILQKQKKEK